MRISTVLCVKLRELTLGCPLPKGLLSAIAKLCSRYSLSDEYNIEDEDIRQVSQSCLNLRELCLHSAECTTTGLEYLTVLPQLEYLELYYTMGEYLSKLNFAKSCPKLEKIIVSDWETGTSRSLRERPFEEASLEDLFPAPVELPSYFETKISRNVQYHPDGLDGYYEVQIDKFTRGYISVLNS